MPYSISASFTTPSLWATLSELPGKASAFIARQEPLVDRICTLVFPLYKAGSAVFFAGYGIKEVLWDQRKIVVEHTNSHEVNIKVQSSMGYPLVHGTFLLMTGICCAFEALHELAFISMDESIKTIAAAGNLSFLFANVLALEENVNLYEQAKSMKNGDTEEEQELAATQMKSAVLGILSNLGYVASTAFALLGGSAGMVLLLACFGSLWGGIKILYDCYDYLHAMQLKAHEI